MNKEIITNGKFNIPLYHATSTLFIDSIKLLGLGGVNIVEQYKLIDLMHYLLRVADVVLKASKDWSSYRFMFDWFAGQKITAAGSNFQHGHTYLTPSRKSALRYALLNRFGSELLSNCEKLYNLIGEKDPSAVDLPEEINEMFSKSYEPIMVIIQGTPVSVLASENGSPVEHNINKLRTFIKIPNILEDETVALNINFRLLGVLTADQFTCEYVDVEKYKDISWCQ